MPAAPKRVAFATVLNVYKDTNAAKSGQVSYLDTKSGTIVNISPSSPMSELQRFKERMAKEPDTLLKVPHITAEENYGDMDEFIRVCVDKKLAERLKLARSGGGTLRNFLDAMESAAPREKEQWKNFREQRIQSRLKHWLSQMGVAVS